MLEPHVRVRIISRNHHARPVKNRHRCWSLYDATTREYLSLYYDDDMHDLWKERQRPGFNFSSNKRAVDSCEKHNGLVHAVIIM